MMISFFRVICSLAGFMLLSTTIVLADPPGDPKPGQQYQRRIYGCSRQPDLQHQQRRHGRLVYERGVCAIWRQLPRMPWSGRSWIELCALPRRRAENHELRGFHRHRHSRQEGRQQFKRPRDAELRREQEHHVLSRPDLYLSARPLDRGHSGVAGRRSWKSRRRSSTNPSMLVLATKPKARNVDLAGAES